MIIYAAGTQEFIPFDGTNIQEIADKFGINATVEEPNRIYWDTELSGAYDITFQEGDVACSGPGVISAADFAKRFIQVSQ